MSFKHSKWKKYRSTNRQIIEIIKEKSLVSINMIKNELGVHHATAERWLIDMLRVGTIRKKNIANKTFWVLDQHED